MKIAAGAFLISPSDLSTFLSCRHKTGLDLAVAHTQLARPRNSNPYAAILQKHGEEHERGYVESLRARGLEVVDAKPTQETPPVESMRLTMAAMSAGVDVVVQARLAGDGIAGYADVLRRVETPSQLGAWSYEAQDTKLARETKGGTILQLSAYSAMLAGMQGLTPDLFHVVTPGHAGTDVPAGATPAYVIQSYRVEDYAAYYRMVLRALRVELAEGHEALINAHYPEPVDACQVCVWAPRCERRRRVDDHLSFIANCGRSNRVELTAQGVATLTAAAEMTVPVTFTPTRGARETYDRIGHQARVQHQQRTEKRPIVERLSVQAGEGLCRLPAPSKGDLFLDLEGASFARDGGREYLFGAYLGTPEGAPYVAFWAMDDAQEKAAFEAVMDLIVRAWEADPGMHVYHFNHYEPTAFKKLMGRYVTRGEELDRLLRAERFVDLYPIVKQSVRAGVESYSIKQLEQYYGYTRQVALPNVREPLVAVEMALEAGAPDAISIEVRDAVQGYNEDDCRSTEALRDWLESMRYACEAEGVAVPRPEDKTEDAAKPAPPVQQEAVALRHRLLAAIPPEASHAAHPDHPTWLLAYLVDWHRREFNAECWEYFRLRDMPEEDLLDERHAVAGLAFVERVGEVTNKKTGRPTGSVIDRYSYPMQDLEIRGTLKRQSGGSFGDVVAHDRALRRLDIRRGPTTAGLPHPTCAFSSEVISNDGLQRSVMRLAERVIAAGSQERRPDAGAAGECGTQLLSGRDPRLRSGPFAMHAGESAQDFATRIATDLDRTTLAIQGPPGAGKTFIGAQMIRALVAAGKKVGVTATSHNVIHNLLDQVVAQAAAAGQPVRVGAKPRDLSEAPTAIAEFGSNEAALEAIVNGGTHVLGGTAFLWARKEFAGRVDVLVVDEAGQMSLANVLAVSHAADNLVLLGDPQQLDQPEKGSHPDGVGISALEHVLGGHETMPAEKGIFLPVTWRMSPTLCAFTSELFYERKLTSKAGLDAQALRGIAGYEGSRLWMVPVTHDGNRSSSMEEVEAVAALVARLLAPGSQWVNEEGDVLPLTAADLRIVAPFNAQVNRLNERLIGGTEVPPGGGPVQVGTVDKFQGQTCAVVIYSMTTSRPEDAPRGMEFLYSPNRLNVATSRARCAVFLVRSPRLLEPECRTPRQMRLANALCRYAEMADVAP